MEPALSSDLLSVFFDNRGNLLSLFNRRTGCEYVTRPGLGLWLIFYAGSHDATRQTTALNALLNVGHTPDEDSVSLGFIKYPFLRAGRTWASQPFIVAVHDRGWHHDARRYRAFADSWQDHRRPRPDWLMETPAMHDIVMLHQHGRVNYRYDQIPEIAAAGKAGDVDVVKLTGWSHGGHDNMYPDFLPSSRPGGEQAMLDNFRRVQSHGYRVCLYFHFAQMSPNSEFYKRHGELCAMKGPGGNPFRVRPAPPWPSGTPRQSRRTLPYRGRAGSFAPPKLPSARCTPRATALSCPPARSRYWCSMFDGDVHTLQGVHMRMEKAGSARAGLG